MSYDLTVYSPGNHSVESVIPVVEGSRGLVLDSEGKDELRILRGSGKVHSFTVDGPFSVSPDDLPEEVVAALPAVSTSFQILVEGNAETEIPHAVSFAKKLSKLLSGVMFDEQTAEIWPQPRTSRPPASRVPPRVDAVELAWYCLADEIPGNLARTYLALAREILPQALPRRFGTYEPLQGDLTRDGDEAFIAAWEQPEWGVSIKATYPVARVSLSSRKSTMANDIRNMRMTIACEALYEEAFRTSVKDFFIRFARESGAFHGTAEVLRGYTLRGKNLGRSPCTEQYRSLGLADGWVGLKPFPQWWMWFGRLYADTVRPYLGGRTEDHGDGLFHSWTEEPANRDALSALMPGGTDHWIPEEFSPVYEEGVVTPKATAAMIPQRLLESRVEPHTWTE